MLQNLLSLSGQIFLAAEKSGEGALDSLLSVPGYILGGLSLVFIILIIVFLGRKTKSQRKVDALVSILEASLQLGNTASMKDVLDTVMNMVKDLFSCGTVAVYLWDRDKGEDSVLALKGIISPHQEKMKDFDPESVDSVVGKVVLKKEPRSIKDFLDLPDDRAISKEKGYRAMCMAPLIYDKNEDAIGALIMGHGTPSFFTDEQFKLFELLANQAALAIHNVQIQKEMNLLAITDSLSGMFTHGYFQDHLTKHVEEARQTGKQLSMMILDVDFFKKVNDHYGHPQGDSLLKQLGSVIRANISPTDVICRYGGDEFTITMLDTAHTQAVLIAKRIREAVEDYEFVLGSNIVHITISGGVGTFPANAETKEELVEAADQCLLLAKQKGRNRIEFAGKG